MKLKPSCTPNTERLRHSLCPVFIELKAGVCLKQICLYNLWCKHIWGKTLQRLQLFKTATLEGKATLLGCLSLKLFKYTKSECCSWLEEWKIIAWEMFKSYLLFHLHTPITVWRWRACWVILESYKLMQPPPPNPKMERCLMIQQALYLKYTDLLR